MAADCLWDTASARVPVETLEGAARDEGVPNASHLIDGLVENGLLDRLPGPDGEPELAYPYDALGQNLVLDRRIEEWRRTHQPLEDAVLEIAQRPWLIEAAAVRVPEAYQTELIDALSPLIDDLPPGDRRRLESAALESLLMRNPGAVTAAGEGRLRAAIRAGLASAARLALQLATRADHPLGGRWLHEQLADQAMAERDASWGIAMYDLDRRLGQFEDPVTLLLDAVGEETDHAVHAGLALSWLLSTPNRLLRDPLSRAMVETMATSVLVDLLESFAEVDAPYVMERLLHVAYARALVEPQDRYLTILADTVSAIAEAGDIPVDVLARDHAHGVLRCAGRSIIDAIALADPPRRPPSWDDLEALHADGGPQPAPAVLWSTHYYGDFGKYVVDGVDSFAPGPTLDHVDVSAHQHRVSRRWARRWIVDRVVEMGWTEDRFDAVEQQIAKLDRGGTRPHPERFGKKYQWLALRELQARVADHGVFAETHDDAPKTYLGPWQWYGRDIDLTRPSARLTAAEVDGLGNDDVGVWFGAGDLMPEEDLARCVLVGPAGRWHLTDDEWVAAVDDLPTVRDLVVGPSEGSVFLERHQSWERFREQEDESRRRRHCWVYLQSWLVPVDDAMPLHELIRERTLWGRWMPDGQRWHNSYFAEAGDAPARFDVLNAGRRPVVAAGRDVWPVPAAANYHWESGSTDASLDESVNLWMPGVPLEGRSSLDAQTAGLRAQDREVMAPISLPGVSGLLADEAWLAAALDDLGMAVVVGVMAQKHASDGEWMRGASKVGQYAGSALRTPEGAVRVDPLWTHEMSG